MPSVCVKECGVEVGNCMEVTLGVMVTLAVHESLLLWSAIDLAAPADEIHLEHLTLLTLLC